MQFNNSIAKMDNDFNNLTQRCEYFDRRLSCDDKEKLKLLSMDKSLVKNFSFQQFVKTTKTFKNTITEFNAVCSEAFFLIGRYDLLPLFNSCEVAVSKRLFSNPKSQVFENKQVLVLKIYNEITKNMEKDFKKHLDEYQVLPPEATHDLNNKTNFTVADILLILCLANHKGIQLIIDIFTKLSWIELQEDAKRLLQLANEKQTKENVYPMDKSPCGVCLIINISEIDNVPRAGSQIDEEALKRTFENFDFIVEKFSNLDSRKLQYVLKSTAERDHSNYSAFVCCIMSHGTCNDLIRTADNQLMNVYDMIDTFSACDTLFGKPKLFIIQACRGDNFQRALLNEKGDMQFDGPAPPRKEVHKTTDYMLARATLRDCLASRSVSKGSIFIQALEKAFNETGDMNEVKLKVNQIVTNETVKIDNRLFTQTPAFEDTLSKYLIFVRKQCAV